MNDEFYTEGSLTFLEKYLNTAAPTGNEIKGQEVWMEYIRQFVDEIRTDSYGTAYGIINPEADYKVVVEAHADEISWYVNYITDNGLLHVIRNGGSDEMIAPSKRVHIHTKKGIVEGVFGWPAIHTRIHKDKQDPPKVDTIWIDVAAKDKAEVEEMGIHVGCMITYPDELKFMNNRYFCGRALDNRIGGFMIAEVARLISQHINRPEIGIYFTNSVQEEVGLNGAKMITETIRPNVALVTDVTHDTTTPMMEKKKDGELECGKGPVIAYAPSVHNLLRELIIETAQEKEIPFQRSAVSRFTGTDTDAFAYSIGGVPSALVSVPLRYMHTTVEMVHKDDVKNVIRVFYEVLMKLRKDQKFSYFDH